MARLQALEGCSVVMITVYVIVSGSSWKRQPYWWRGPKRGNPGHFDANIFGYSFVLKIFIQIYSDIRSYHFLETNIFGYSFVSKSIRMSHSDTNASANTWWDKFR